MISFWQTHREPIKNKEKEPLAAQELQVPVLNCQIWKTGQLWRMSWVDSSIIQVWIHEYRWILSTMVFITEHFSAAFNLNPVGRWRTLLYKLLLYTVFASSSNLFDSFGSFWVSKFYHVFKLRGPWWLLFFLACFAFMTGDTPPPWRHHQRAATAMHQLSPFHIFKWLLT